MKKFLKVVGVICLAFILILVFYQIYSKGVFDTRFWGNNSSDYQTFQPGIYTCNESFLVPGDYDVIVKGGVDTGGFIFIYQNKDDTNDRETVSSTTVHAGDKGFHFSIKDGQTVEIAVRNPTEMKIKKVG